MLGATALAFDRAASDHPRDRDSKSIDGVAGSKRHNPQQHVEHGHHRAASHKQRARHLCSSYPQTAQIRSGWRIGPTVRFSLLGATNLKAEFFNDSS